MEKIKPTDPLAKSEDLIAQNIEQLKALFPEITAEGKIDFKVLKHILGEEIEEEEEYYRFTWAGKAQARMEAHKPSTGTLRPAKEESVDWDTTQNLYIEGDNLEVLKLLQKSYAGKVKMIYIDPPYNTGKDFVYKDNYKDNLRNYQEVTGQVDSEGNKLSTNSDSDGRYHSNWINLMYPRLRLARNLLKKDGVIFISIDDNESNNLRKLCDEIFGENNFIADICVVNNLKGRNDKRYIATANERLFMYVKTDIYEECGLRLPETRISEFNLEDEIGKFRELGLRKRGGADTREQRPKMFYPLYVNPLTGEVSLFETSQHTIEVLPRKSDNTDGCWRWGSDTARLKIKTLFGREVSNGAKWDIFEKDYLETDGELRRIKPKSVFSGTIYSTDRATKEFRALMDDADFSSPKSVSMLMDVIEYSVPIDSNEIVLDFFSGSASTAHAIMEINAINKGNINYILVQLPEPTEKDSSNFKNGYFNICEIGKERIRRAAKKIAAENPEKAKDLDLGFKVFMLDSSNIRPWDGNPDNLEDDLFNAGDNIKSDRSAEDVLYEVLLKYGLDLTLPIEERDVEGNKVFSVGYGALFVCLDKEIKGSVAEGIGKWKEELQPELCRVIFRDAGFTDVAKTNATQTLKRFGITEVRSV